MPIIDRRYNLKLIADAVEKQNPKDEGTLTVDSFLKNRKGDKKPDFIAPTNPSKK